MRRLLTAIRQPPLNPSRVHLERLIREAAALLPDDTRVLDAGAGTCEYRSLFEGARYEAADLAPDPSGAGCIDYICDLDAIPVEDGSYDLILFTQVLQLVPDPVIVLREFHRVPAPGGRLLMSAPLAYEEYPDPYDYYRYTQSGLSLLLERAGFHIETLEWLEGYYGTLSYQCSVAARDFPWQPGKLGGDTLSILLAAPMLGLKVAFRVLADVFARIDVRHKVTGVGYATNYWVVATRDKGV
jgi:SAM-dependent methyltransferase